MKIKSDKKISLKKTTVSNLNHLFLKNIIAGNAWKSMNDLCESMDGVPCGTLPCWTLYYTDCNC